MNGKTGGRGRLIKGSAMGHNGLDMIIIII
jgi:hypothetical protein